jgi:hypothetical protein
MAMFLKFMQALGIATMGLSLIAGIVRNSMGEEYMYAGIGMLIFYIARYVETRVTPH